MRRSLTVFTAAILSATAGAAFANMDIVKKNNCLACHAVDTDIFGPSFKKVAAKHRGDAGAEKRLAAKIKAGGKGVWGEVPMPAQPQVSEADAQALAKYVLSIK